MSQFIELTPLVGDAISIAESHIVYGEAGESGGTLLYLLSPGKTIKDTLEVTETMAAIQVLSETAAGTEPPALFVSPVMSPGNDVNDVLHNRGRVAVIYDVDPCQYQYDLTQPGTNIWVCDGDKTDFELYMAGN